MAEKADHQTTETAAGEVIVDTKHMDFSEFQRRAKRTRVFKVHVSDAQSATEELARHYLFEGLTAQIGKIAGRLKKKMRDGDDYSRLKEELAEQLGHSLWYIAMLADELGLDLNEVAANNALFNERRWPHEADLDRPPLRDFDAGSPDDQKLPQKLVARFETTKEGELEKTVVQIYPSHPDLNVVIPFGDAIDDNSVEEDYYRYHDVYHLAYVAFLAWSPVVRKLLNCKRKKSIEVDRIEDGARARDLEEATTAFIYAYVRGQNYLSTSENIDTSVLVDVCKLVRGQEVKVCFEKEWEQAIIEATKILRLLVKNKGGWVEVDRPNRAIRYLAEATGGASK